MDEKIGPAWPKTAIALVVILALSIAFWAMLSPLTHGLDPLMRKEYFSPIFAFIPLVSVFGLIFLIFDSDKIRMTAAGLCVLPFIFVFNFRPAVFLISAVALFLFWYSARKFDSERNNRIKISVWHSLRYGSSRILTALFLMVAVAVYSAPEIHSATKGDQIPELTGRIVERVSNGLFGLGILDKIAKDVFLASPRLVEGQAAYRFNVYSQILVRPYVSYAPLVLAIGLFLVLEALSYIFVWVSILLAWLIFRLLKSLKVVKIETIQKETQKISF